jgi:Zn-dependent protease with chaperone function
LAWVTLLRATRPAIDRRWFRFLPVTKEERNVVNHEMSHVLFRAGWLMFELLAIASLLIVLLAAYAVLPVLVALARGSYVRPWFWGNSGLAVSAAALYLAVAIVVFAKKRSRGARR